MFLCAISCLVSQLVTSLGVRDEAGLLVGSVSSSDVFYVVSSQVLFAKLCQGTLTVSDLIASRSEQSEGSLVTCRSASPCLCSGETWTSNLCMVFVFASSSSTLQDVLEVLCDKRVHHVYVVDEGVLHGVVSICDVLNTLVTERPNHWHVRVM